MKKYYFPIMTVLLCCMICTLTACATPKSETEGVDDILNYDFSYEEVPGSSLSLRFLWDGYDPNNKFGPKDLREEVYTYRTEYEAADSGYRLVYLKKSVIEKILPAMERYGDRYAPNPYYAFSGSAESDIIDGKYVYAYREYEEKDKKDILLRTVDSYENAPFTIGKYQLVFCVQSKTVTVHENVSTDKTLNRPVTLYAKLLLKNTAPEENIIYEENYDGGNSVGRTKFEYEGEKLECYPDTLESENVFYVPYFAMKALKISPVGAYIVEHDGVKYVELARFRIEKGEKVDLLCDDTDFSMDNDDFGPHKAEFLDAYVRKSKVIQSWEYGLFNYEKVKDIIKRK